MLDPNADSRANLSEVAEHAWVNEGMYGFHLHSLALTTSISNPLHWPHPSSHCSGYDYSPLDSRAAEQKTLERPMVRLDFQMFSLQPGWPKAAQCHCGRTQTHGRAEAGRKGCEMMHWGFWCSMYDDCRKYKQTSRMAPRTAKQPHTISSPNSTTKIQGSLVVDGWYWWRILGI